MEEDGACLFRAVADQVYGDQEMHAIVRSHCMDYIVSIRRMKVIMLYTVDSTLSNGFIGLGVACWPLVPKFVGSDPAEAVGFLGRKNPQHTFLRRGSKAVGRMS
jgi:hypothetical protein